MSSLEAHGIKARIFEHPPVFTVEESVGLHGTIPGAHTKNLFLKGESGKYWLVTLPHHWRADLKFIGRKLGERRLSFAKPDAMERLLSVSPGAVTPVAAINDRDRAVQVVVDESFLDSGTICVHPLRNTATISMSTADLIRMLEHWGHRPLILNLQPGAE